MQNRLYSLRNFGGLLFAVAFLMGPSVANREGLLYAAPKAEAALASQPAAIVNVNKATAEELQSIRGIGPSLAERVIQYRAEHGRFEKVEDLTQVRGIGEAKLQKIKNQVSV